MRYLGIDLGTTTLGLAITDKTNKIVLPLEVIKFQKDDYTRAIDKLTDIIDKNQITDVVIGLPKNMDNTLGFAAQRSQAFSKLLLKLPVRVHFQDERLTTVEATNLIKRTGAKNIKQKNIVDAIAAHIILTSYLEREKNGK